MESGGVIDRWSGGTLGMVYQGSVVLPCTMGQGVRIEHAVQLGARAAEGGELVPCTRGQEAQW